MYSIRASVFLTLYLVVSPRLTLPISPDPYTQKGMLDDKDPDQRKRGIAAANWLAQEVIDLVAVYAG